MFPSVQEVTEDYELVRPLGTGGFAKVYVGKSLATGQDVAIKRIDMLKYVHPRLYACSVSCCAAMRMCCGNLVSKEVPQRWGRQVVLMQ